jgi:hypothetical protein
MRKSEWLFVDGCERKRSISSAKECLNSCQDKADSLSVVTDRDGTSVEQMNYI